jgi:hypothetical protein
MPRFVTLPCILVLLASAAASGTAFLAPRLGNMWSDEMALQHGLPFNISGFGHPFSTVLPYIDHVQVGSSAECGADGIFVIEFAAQPATANDLMQKQGHVSWD